MCLYITVICICPISHPSLTSTENQLYTCSSHLEEAYYLTSLCSNGSVYADTYSRNTQQSHTDVSKANSMGIPLLFVSLLLGGRVVKE